MKNLIARFKLRAFMFNERPSVQLDDIFIEIMSYPLKNIKEFSIGEYHIKIKFAGDVEFEAWNANQYFAWLQSGLYRKNRVRYAWKDKRPNVYVMLRFRNYLRFVCKSRGEELKK